MLEEGGGRPMTARNAPMVLAEDLSVAARRHVGAFYEENPFLALLGARVTQTSRGQMQIEAEDFYSSLLTER